MAEIDTENCNRSSTVKLFDIQRSLPDLKAFAHEIEKDLPAIDGDGSVLSPPREQPLGKKILFQRTISESVGMRPGRNAPLTYRDKEGLQWFIRGPADVADHFEPPRSHSQDSDSIQDRGEKKSVDKYGFLVVGDRPSLSKSLTDTKNEILREERRIKKWRTMLGSGNSDWTRYVAKKPRELKRRIQKGIPDCMRGLVWQMLSGSRELLKRNIGYYEHLVFYSSSQSELDIIRDIHRTFPTHVYFQQRSGPGQRALYNVLKAYSIYDKDVGYVQGMGFIAGLLLLYMGEEDAFWLLVSLLKGEAHEAMQGFYLPGLPLLHQSIFQLERLLEALLPRLGAHLAREGVPGTLFASHWFITVFAYSLPFSLAIRVWDCFMLMGMEVIFQVGLAILKSLEPQLLELSFESIVHLLRNIPEDCLDPATLFPLAFSFKITRKLREAQMEFLNVQSPSHLPASLAERADMDADMSGDQMSDKDEEDCAVDIMCSNGITRKGSRGFRASVSAIIFSRRLRGNVN